MNKTFVVEIEYNETDENVKNESHVLYDQGLESTLEEMMDRYIEYGSIKGGYNVSVKEMNNNA